MKKYVPSVILLLIVFTTFSQEANQFFKPLKYRSIGPFRGGRSVTASGVIGDPLTYYMGTTGGGLWKTNDAGQRWENISDGFFKTGSVGAVSVSESNPNIIYCGMGEHAIRGVMTSYGDGVYKSTDAGKTWVNIGLEKTQQISRIVIHPSNPDIVFVAAQGAYSSPTKERGIYKSIDGGKNWKNVLFVNDLTGGVELSMDMNFPEIIYAAMWEHQRTPWKIISGGEGSGLYKSTNGGDTWEKIHEGLPKEKGKMAIAVSRSNSNKVYALIESDSEKDLGGLFFSNDSGKNWNRVSDDNRLTQRAWYYTEVFVDPTNENVVYVLSAPALRSIDGGKNWELIEGQHGDYHDLWINPNNANNMILADDGGAVVSFDYAKTWSKQSNMPTAQFYRVIADNLFPYNLYGGQQDNSSVKIASLSTGRRSITEQDWTPAAGGESAFLAFNPDDPRYVVGGSYLGTIEVLDMKSKIGTSIMAAPIQYLGREARNMKYLFNWNAPIVRSKHESETYYHGAQLVLKTKDMGITWEEISQDLTRNIDEKQGDGGGPYTNEAVGAENYGTLSYIIESPQEKGVIWTGSDDGFVYLTKNGGANWINVTPKGLQECLINAIEVSPHDPATAYIATTRYKFNDKTPSIYKTINYGETWKNISVGIPYGAYTRVVREDTKRKNLLYAGTETGIYISWNGGSTWESFQLNLPITPINDLMVHKGNLLIATSGRSFWILDDLGLLAQYKKEIDKVNLYTPEKSIYGSWKSPLNSNNPSFNGSNAFEGVNPANGVVIYYELPKLSETDTISLEIRNSAGNLIRSISSIKDPNYKEYDGGPSPAPTLSKNEGLNRFVWDMRYPIMPGIPYAYMEASFKGHMTPPGTYTINLKVGNTVKSTKGIIEENPNYVVDSINYTIYDNFMSSMEESLTEMHEKVNKLKTVQEQLKNLISNLKLKDENQNIVKQGNELITKLTVWDEKMIQRKSKAYDDVENFKNKFTAEYIYLINQTENLISRVNQSSKDRKIELDKQWEILKGEATFFSTIAIPEFNKKLWEAGIGAIQYN
ncbi:glycosyl hydrolase [Lutibacter sp.]|uniref:VPS10 domain-containing protein n=1 Tax=Lutibacter sp. TaxID=1925666 RepID=UPI0027349025|nr:glycosyl hydrolase [Lutibacter sp.]MDP3312642.1 glycosyl hydrolase [Lutibacter sp.]